MATSSEIRRQFIDFFVQRHEHCFVPSSSVVPHDDPTLLFTNAGMNQFKDVFLGTGHRDYCRAVNSQKCIRAGGKHNDLEDVGQDTYHHTFFEMLGNWSFGDYFKEQAIGWAWDLLVNVWGLDKSRLHATVFGGDAAEGLQADQDAADLWVRLTDIDPSHIHRGGRKDNFWEMGDMGPCGPCSEVHIDLTSDKSGGGLVNAGDARVIEIWNLVFIQFNRDIQGKLSPLPAKHVDTGMGFERICAVLQGKVSNYDTDVFEPIFRAIHEFTGAPMYGGQIDHEVDMAHRVIADHIRCLTVALTDGAVPSNEGRGYVLRRILRRAVRHGYQTLGVKDPFLYKLVPSVVEALGAVFAELQANPQRVVDLIRDEEESFGKTLDRGIALFSEAAGQTLSVGPSDQMALPSSQRGAAALHSQSDGHVRSGSVVESKIISAQDAFKLHDTYGFPLDLTQVMARERGMEVDVAGFDRLMAQARTKARAAGGKRESTFSLVQAVQRDNPPATDFLGYGQTEIDVETFCYLYRLMESDCERLDKATQGDELAVVLGHTPFYAEAGGQVGDGGTIQHRDGGVFRVRQTVKVGNVHFHLGQVESGQFRQVPPMSADVGTEWILKVDSARRRKIMANHTGTHLMNRALRDLFGDHVQQRGSLVDDEKLRFDFSHNMPVGVEQIDHIEQMVNQDITADLTVYADEVAQDEALKINGLRAVFGEKYPPRVRVVSIGVPVSELLARPDNADWRRYSIEFCGGTHLGKTGDAEGFIAINEEAVAKGVRRITAVTGQAAQRAAVAGDMLLARLETLRGMPAEQFAEKLNELTTAMESKLLPLLAKAKLRDGVVELQQILKNHAKQRNKQSAGAVVEVARKIADETQGDLIVTSLEGADANALRVAMDVIRKKRPDTALLMGGVCGERIAFLAVVPKAMIEKGLKAGDWVREVAKVAGGGGGGRSDMAQAGGKDPQKLEEALAVGRQFAQSRL